jgi:hypothetical protein
MPLDIASMGLMLAGYVVTFLLGRELSKGFAAWRATRRDRSS